MSLVGTSCASWSWPVSASGRPVAHRPSTEAQGGRGDAGGIVSWVPFGSTAPATWTSAFAGVETMFLLRPPAISRASRRDLLPAVAAAQQAGLRHVVFLSLQGAQRNRVVPHAKVESWLRASGLGWTFVRPSFFTQNLSTTHAADIRDLDQIIVPAGGGRDCVRRRGGRRGCRHGSPAASQRPQWAGVDGTGPEALTYTQVAQILTEVSAVRSPTPVRGCRATCATPGRRWTCPARWRL